MTDDKLREALTAAADEAREIAATSYQPERCTALARKLETLAGEVLVRGAQQASATLTAEERRVLDDLGIGSEFVGVTTEVEAEKIHRARLAARPDRSASKVNLSAVSFDGVTTEREALARVKRMQAGA